MITAYSRGFRVNEALKVRLWQISPIQMYVNLGQIHAACSVFYEIVIFFMPPAMLPEIIRERISASENTGPEGVDC